MLPNGRESVCLERAESLGAILEPQQRLLKEHFKKVRLVTRETVPAWSPNMGIQSRANSKSYTYALFAWGLLQASPLNECHPNI